MKVFRHKELFRGKFIGIQLIIDIFDDSPMLGIKVIKIPGMNFDDDLEFEIQGFYNIEIGLIFITIQINIEHKN